MLKVLSEGPGYVYYVAVPPRFRRQGIGGRLLDDAVSRFAKMGVRDVYASVEEDNLESKTLFGSRGFERVGRVGDGEEVRPPPVSDDVPRDDGRPRRAPSREAPGLSAEGRPGLGHELLAGSAAASSAAGLSCFFHILG